MFTTKGRHRKLTGARHRKSRQLIPAGAVMTAAFLLAAVPFLFSGGGVR